jgi:hypothetical protein
VTARCRRCRICAAEVHGLYCAWCYRELWAATLDEGTLVVRRRDSPPVLTVTRVIVDAIAGVVTVALYHHNEATRLRAVDQLREICSHAARLVKAPERAA